MKHLLDPIIAYLFTVWDKVNKLAKMDSFFCQSPNFRNHSLLIDGKPISFPQWSEKAVHYIQDITGPPVNFRTYKNL